MSFALTRGVDHTAIIRGTDKHGVSGAQVVNTETYDTWLEAISLRDSGDAADDAIRAIFKPLFDVIEAEEEATVDPLDPMRVVQEPQEHVRGSAGFGIELDHDGLLVAAVLEGHSHRLNWVNNELFLEAVEADVSVEEEGDEDDIKSASRSSMFSRKLPPEALS